MRLAVLADVHGNLSALEAVVTDMAERRIDRVVNLGDCVSGPLWPRETLAFLREQDWLTVRGNHDRWVGESDPADLIDSDRFTHASLSTEGRSWLAGLPRRLDLGGGIMAMHARPECDNAYLIEDQWGERLVRAGPATIRARLGSVEAALVLTAHSHIPDSVKLPGGPWIVNPGSVGCPAYDDDSTDPPHISEQGSPAARYAIVATGPAGFTIELMSVPYPNETAARQAAASGQPAWAHALRTGFALRPAEPGA